MNSWHAGADAAAMISGASRAACQAIFFRDTWCRRMKFLQHENIGGGSRTANERMSTPSSKIAPSGHIIETADQG
jgi:hypothetical protein